MMSILQTYVLLYVDAENKPRFLQGSIATINAELQKQWLNGEIDRDEWDFSNPWELLGIEDGRLTPVERVECTSIPQFEVH